MATKTKPNAIINFVYFTHNFPSDFIEKVWGEETSISISKHLNEKLLGYAKDSGCVRAGDVLKFFLELDRENQELLATWIEENYKAFTDL